MLQEQHIAKLEEWNIWHRQTNRIYGKRWDILKTNQKLVHYILETNEIFENGWDILQTNKTFDKHRDIGTGSNKIFGTGRNRQRSYREANQSAGSQTLPG